MSADDAKQWTIGVPLLFACLRRCLHVAHAPPTPPYARTALWRASRATTGRLGNRRGSTADGGINQ
jgi:hypothetical protein